ncbi:MAG: hypothetical protein H7Y04_09155 [Verrucomicrobia bacterium]|nr:hypothetical protein [Cytophagales bacterium]
MIRCLTFFCLFFWCMTVACQETNPSDNNPLFENSIQVKDSSKKTFPHYRIWSVGLGGQTLRDPLISTLRYNGTSLGTQVTTLKFRPKFLTVSTLSGHFNLLSSEATGASIWEGGGIYNFTMLKKLPKTSTKRTTLFMGGFAEGSYNLRFARSNINNLYAYDGVLAIGVSGLVQHTFRIFRRDFMLANHVSIPVFSVLSRPPFAWSYPYFLGENGKISEAFQVGSWNRYFKFANKLSLDFYTKSNKKHQKVRTAWRFSYQYEYFSIPKPNFVQSGTDWFTIGRIRKF